MSADGALAITANPVLANRLHSVPGRITGVSMDGALAITASRAHANHLRSVPGRITGVSVDGALATMVNQECVSPHLNVRERITGASMAGVPEAKLLQTLKRKILAKRRLKEHHFQRPEAYKIKSWPVVYAALGDLKTGATLEDILRRTKLTAPTALATLKALEDLSALWSLQNLANATKANLNRQDHMFLSSTFSIKKSQLETIKNDIQEYIQNRIVDLEVADGEAILTLTVGLLPH